MNSPGPRGQRSSCLRVLPLFCPSDDRPWGRQYSGDGAGFGDLFSRPEEARSARQDLGSAAREGKGLRAIGVSRQVERQSSRGSSSQRAPMGDTAGP
eukprot:9485254-Alexandrium_andersonii.AAC.1